MWVALEKALASSPIFAFHVEDTNTTNMTINPPRTGVNVLHQTWAIFNTLLFKLFTIFIILLVCLIYPIILSYAKLRRSDLAVSAWALYHIRKIAGCACAGNVFPVMHVGIANPLWWGKRSRHSRRMRNPQFYVSGKRPRNDIDDFLYGCHTNLWGLSLVYQSNRQGSIIYELGEYC